MCETNYGDQLCAAESIVVSLLSRMNKVLAILHPTFSTIVVHRISKSGNLNPHFSAHPFDRHGAEE